MAGRRVFVWSLDDMPNARAAQLARLHFRTIFRERGETVRYRPHGSSEAVELDLVAAGQTTEDVGSLEAPLAAGRRGWLALADDVRQEVGRMPEDGDTITRRDPLENPAGDPDAETQRLRVSRGENPRAWRSHGAHGGLIRFETILEG